MLRRIVRDGIRAVARGEDPFGVAWPEDKAIRTFTQDVVLRVPPAPTLDDEIGGSCAPPAARSWPDADGHRVR